MQWSNPLLKNSKKMTCSDFPVVDSLDVKIVSPWCLIFPLVGFLELSFYYRAQLANQVEKFIAMNTCKSLFSPDQKAKLRAYDRWHRALDDCSLRMDYPDAYITNFFARPMKWIG